MLSIILGLVAKILVSHNFFFDFTRLFPTLASQYQLFFFYYYQLIVTDNI